jgi:endonuclease/exonuclease/phosphatase family metal-dependent hydrolase
LEEIQAALATNGLNLPNRLLVSGFDTNVHIALLSRYPFAATRAHTSESFLIGGKRFHVGRGFAEVDVQINSNHVVTIIGAHLKSKRQVAQADEEELRIEEAKILRERIDELLAANPAISLIVMGDLNDSKDAPSTKTIIGTGKNKLLDVRPAERSGAHIPKHELDSREITWTHFFSRDDVYSRLDYILLSPAIAHHILRDETFVLALPDWGIASDHRPIVVSLAIDD